MNVAFVKHAKYDVDGNDGGQDQHRFRRERILEDLSRSLEAASNRVRHIDVLGCFLDYLCRLLERSTGVQVKRECDRGKLALVIYRGRSIGGFKVCNGAERNLDAG